MSSPLTGVASAFPLPNTCTAPDPGDPVRAEDVQIVAQALLNQDRAIETLMPRFLQYASQISGDGGEGNTSVDITNSTYTYFPDGGLYDFSMPVAGLVTGQLMIVTVNGHIRLHEDGIGDRGYARLVIVDPSASVITNTAWVVTTEVDDYAVPFSLTVPYVVVADGTHTLRMQGKTALGGGGNVGLAHTFSYTALVFRI